MVSWWMQEDMQCITCGEVRPRWMAKYYLGKGFECRTCERERTDVTHLPEAADG